MITTRAPDGANKSHVSLSVMLNLIAHTALYTGCFFYCSHLVDCWLPPRKVISMELVPPNRKNDLSTLVPPETQKITEFFQLLKTLSSFVLWVGPVYLVFFVWLGWDQCTNSFFLLWDPFFMLKSYGGWWWWWWWWPTGF